MDCKNQAHEDAGRLTNIPKGYVRQYILDLAARHDVFYVETKHDKFANTITQLSGDDVHLDEIQLLLIELVRSGVIKAEEMPTLQIDYLRDKDLEDSKSSSLSI